MRLPSVVATGYVLGCAMAADCELSTESEPIVQSLSGLTAVSFQGFKPVINRFEGEPLLKIVRWSSDPIVEVSGGKLVVSKASCDATAPPASKASSVGKSFALLAPASMVALLTAPSIPVLGVALALTTATYLPTTFAQEGSCDDIIEVEIHGPVVEAGTQGPFKSEGAIYMEDMILVESYDGEEDSLHFTADPSWASRVNASRNFRQTASGSVYNYRNKILMGMSQTSILNRPTSVTAKDDVVFDVPADVVRPDTDEGVLMLSVLEMQSLLRQGSITSVELTNMALAMLELYDPEYNMLEVELSDLALAVAAEADAMFANGTIVSEIQGIPFAIKDTYDVKGYATMYGSWEFMDNIREEESPLVTYAIQAGAVPLFKSSVPQLTWGTANYKGTVYSCLNGGYSAGASSSGGSSIGSGAAVCLGVVPVAICEQTGSSCQSPAIANGISTVIPALGTFSRENNGLYSMETDRPGLLCRDIMSCAVFYNRMRGASAGDPQSRDVPFADPSKEDLSNYTIGFVDNSDTDGWPLAWDTPFKGQRGNVVTALEALGADVIVEDSIANFIEPSQLYTDIVESGIQNTLWFDWYWLNVEGFFEEVFKYGADEGAMAYGPVWVGQNFNFDDGFHREHIGASAYAYLDSLWMFGYAAEMAMYPMLQTMPDVIVHFAQSELNAAYDGDLIKRAGINTVHIPEFYWNTTDETFVDWTGSRPADYYEGTAVSAAMITCESKKYEPVKAFAVCYQLQQALVPGGKLISPNKDVVREAIQSGAHDLDCPYDWSDKREGYLDSYPTDVREKVLSKLGNIGSRPTCPVPGATAVEKSLP